MTTSCPCVFAYLFLKKDDGKNRHTIIELFKTDYLLTKAVKRVIKFTPRRNEKVQKVSFWNRKILNTFHCFSFMQVRHKTHKKPNVCVLVWDYFTRVSLLHWYYYNRVDCPKWERFWSYFQFFCIIIFRLHSFTL